MKRVLVLVLCLVLAVASLASCEMLGNGGEEHTHTYGDTWETDADYHWHKATCEHTDVKSSVGDHVDEDKNGECDICSYGDAHVHAFTDAWTTNETQHWHAATCSHAVKISVGNHVDADANGECDICAYGDAHIHTFTDAWTTDENNHWHAASCECESVKASEGAHVDNDANGECDICAYGDAHIHTFTDTWVSNETQHWHAASCTGHSDVKVSVGNHADSNGDGYCDVCNYVINETSADHVHTFADVWTVDATGHWHAATCDHSDMKAVFTAHKDADTDSICDVCGYEITYTVTVGAFDNVTLSGESFTVNNGANVTFTATVNSDYKLIAKGATQVGDAIIAEGNATYTYVIESVSANSDVEIISVITDYAKASASGTFAITDLEYDSFWGSYSGNGSVTINFTAAGHYYILASYDNDAYTDGITVDDEYYSTYEGIEITEAGERVVNFAASTDTSTEQINVKWSVISIVSTEATIYEAKGDGYILPEGMNVDITFVAPAPGVYQFSSTDKDIVWDDEIGKIMFVVASEAGEMFNFTVKKNSVDTGVFDFDWDAELVTPVTITTGENKINLSNGKYAALTITPEFDGLYEFTAENYSTSLYVWSSVESWDGTISWVAVNLYGYIPLEAGESITIYALNNDEMVYEEADSFEETITAKYFGEVVTVEGETISVSISAEGTPTILAPSSEGTYEINAPEGVTMSFDGGETWVSSYVVVFEYFYGNYDPENISVIVKASEGETAELEVTEIEVDVEVEVGGETAVTLVPGIAYNLNLSGLAQIQSGMWDFKIKFVLTWDNTSVSVYTDSGEITSGATVTEYVDNAITMMLADDAASCEVTLSLADANATEIEAGDLAILSYGTNVYKYFIPDVNGYYLINVTGADTVVTVNGIEYESGEFAELELTAGEYVSIIANASVNAEFTIAYLGEEKSAATDYNVVVAANGFYIIAYTANANGKHTLSVANGETNALVKLVTITNNNGYGENYVSYVFGDTVIDASKTSYEFELGKGKTVYFVVSTIDGAADTVNLSAVLTEEATATEYVAEYDGNEAVSIAFTAETSGYYKFVLKQYNPELGANVTLHEIGTWNYETILDYDLWGGEQIVEVTIYIEAGVEYEILIQNWTYTSETIIVTVEAV